MRIYEITIEHKRYGMNWQKLKVAAQTCKQAIIKAEAKLKTKQERIQSVELLASED